MEAFLTSTGVVALAEVGDKTQLLALLLAARFRKPVPIVLGILLATLGNHAVAGAAGSWLTRSIDGQTLRLILGVSFLVMAAWASIPDRRPDQAVRSPPFGAFISALIAFFLVETGDKTQIATVALAARFVSIAPVVAGTTLGMLIANVPAVWLGDRFAHALPLKALRGAAAASFLALGLYVLAGH